MSERNEILLLDDIIEAALKINKYIQSYSYERFYNRALTESEIQALGK